MKGIVFTEFLEMVEADFGADVVDDIIESSDLPTGGAYTAVGTYSPAELVRMVTCLARTRSIPLPQLLSEFGRHLFRRFAAGYPHFFRGVSSTFDLLQRVDGYIHVEVLKLYPDAELPRFECELESADRLLMRYRSARALPDVAEGLILQAAEHFGESVTVSRSDLSLGAGTEVLFTIERKDADERSSRRD